MDKDISFYDYVHQNSEHLYSHALRLTKNEHDAEDLVGEAILRAMKSEGFYEEHENMSGWLYVIMRNIHFDNVRRLKLRRIDARGLRYTCEMSDNLSKKAIYEAVEKLPPGLKEAFKLYVTGYKYEEIALISNKNINTTKGLIRKARLRLRDMLN